MSTGLSWTNFSDIFSKTQHFLSIKCMSAILWWPHSLFSAPYGIINMVNIGQGKGLMPDGTKPLLNQCWHISNWVLWHSLDQFHTKCSRYQLLQYVTKYNLQLQSHLPEANELSHWHFSIQNSGTYLCAVIGESIHHLPCSTEQWRDDSWSLSQLFDVNIIELFPVNSYGGQPQLTCLPQLAFYFPLPFWLPRVVVEFIRATAGQRNTP